MTSQRLPPGHERKTPDTVLLTGATGYFGRWTAHELAGRRRVVLTARTFPGGPSDFDVRICADLTREADIRRLHTATPVGRVRLIHLAGDHRSSGPERLLQANVEPLLRLLDMFGNRLSHVTLASSVAVYGFPPGPRGPHPVDPLTAYGRSKWLAEQAAGLFRQYQGIPLAVLRLASLYGEGGCSNAVGTLAQCAADGDTFVIGPGPHGLSARDYLHAEDGARAVVAASDTLHDGTLDIGSGTALTPFDLVQAARQVGGRVEVSAQSSVAEVVSRFACDTGPAERALGFRPRVTLADGVRRTLSWHRASGHQEAPR